ncbi:hypothetical protein Tco_0397949 [Tanacetum coccineum]
MLTKPQVFFDNNMNQALGFQNPLYLKKAQQMRPMLYDGDVIAKGTNVISIPDSEETLILAEETFCSLQSLTSSDTSSSCRPTKVEVPNELPKVSLVHTSLKKLKRHLANFDVVVKQRTTPTAITDGSWEFKHTKACFRDQIIPCVKALKDLFNTFDQYLIDELLEVQNVFHQMEQAVEQHRLEAKSFEIKQRQILTENCRLLDQVLFHDIMNVVVNNSVNVNSFVAMKDYMHVSNMFVEKCQKCLELENELRENSVSNESNPTFDQFFELNDLQAQLQEKDTTITQLKEKVKDLRKSPDRVKKEYDAIETINIELKHSVAKLLSKNENLSKEIMHLKQIFKEQFDSIKKSRVDSSVAQLNLKYVENVDFQPQIQEKILEIEILENELKRIKGKHVVDSVEQKPKVITIAHGMENANVLQEIVEEVRASSPLDGELDLACKYAERIQVELIYVHGTCPCLATPKERLVAFNHKNKDSKIKPADPDISSQNKEKIVDVTPMNKHKKVSFTEPIASLSNSPKKIGSSKTTDSNKPVLSSTGLKNSTKVRRSQPSSNKRNDRIPQP